MMHFWYRSMSFFSPSKKKSFLVAHEAMSAPLAGCHYASRTATHANMSHRSSLIKASALWMYWSLRDVDKQPGQLSSVTLVLPCLKELKVMVQGPNFYGPHSFDLYSESVIIIHLYLTYYNNSNFVNY
jgi:hypothetical protein